jgi:hypothetical protein
MINDDDCRRRRQDIGIVVVWSRGGKWWGVNRSSKRAARHSVTLGLDQDYLRLGTAERRQLFFFLPSWEEEELPPGGGEHYASDGGSGSGSGRKRRRRRRRVVVAVEDVYALGRRAPPVMAPALLAFLLLCRWMGRPLRLIQMNVNVCGTLILTHSTRY